MGFGKLELDDRLIKGLNMEGITAPLPVQELAFPAVMEGRDAAVQAETGSGKTLAYLLPLMQKLLVQKEDSRVLILVPTHELALQVVRQVRSLSGQLGHAVRAVPVVGNVNIRRQAEALKEKPQIIAGTTGRILELIEKKKIQAHLVGTVVIDEADNMLDTSQIEETKAVLKKCVRDVQKLFFSASIPERTAEQIRQIAPDVQMLRTHEEMVIPENIHHIYIVCEMRGKMQTLRSVLSAANPQKAMVFINRAYDIEEAADKLKHHRYAAECIHGSSSKEERKQVVERFRQGKLRILIGTDIAARGLHFDDVDLVVHYSIPENPKDYLHRAGRTGRNGKSGRSISLVTERELPLIKRCGREFGIKLQECVLKNGMLLPAESAGRQKRTDAANGKKRTGKPADRKRNGKKDKKDKKSKKSI